MGSIAYMHSGHNCVVFFLSHVSVIISSHAVPLNRTLHFVAQQPSGDDHIGRNLLWREPAPFDNSANCVRDCVYTSLALERLRMVFISRRVPKCFNKSRFPEDMYCTNTHDILGGEK